VKKERNKMTLTFHEVKEDNKICKIIVKKEEKVISVIGIGFRGGYHNVYIKNLKTNRRTMFISNCTYGEGEIFLKRIKRLLDTLYSMI
jgi:hypothetical protein